MIIISIFIVILMLTGHQAIRTGNFFQRQIKHNTFYEQVTKVTENATLYEF